MTLKKDRDDVYRTDHLYVAAFLICLGHAMIGTSIDGHRVSFVFTQTAKLSSDVASFMSGAAIPARQFCFEILKLKRLLPRSGETVKKNEDAAKIQHYRTTAI
jgi:hypothetical protein